MVESRLLDDDVRQVIRAVRHRAVGVAASARCREVGGHPSGSIEGLHGALRRGVAVGPPGLVDLGFALWREAALVLPERLALLVRHCHHGLQPFPRIGAAAWYAPVYACRRRSFGWVSLELRAAGGLRVRGARRGGGGGLGSLALGLERQHRRADLLGGRSQVWLLLAELGEQRLEAEAGLGDSQATHGLEEGVERAGFAHDDERASEAEGREDETRAPLR